MNYCINTAWRWWHCSGVTEDPVALMAVFGSSAFLGLVSHFFHLTPTIQVWWPVMHSNNTVIEPAFGTFGSVVRCPVLLENEIGIFNKACQQKEA